jgi:hypothetical protein
MNEQIIQVQLSTVLPVPVLAGAKGGEAAFLLLRAAIPALSPGQLVVVDFGQMQICTASAIRELLVPMWKWLRENGCVGIVGNADEVTLDEIKLVADTSKQPFICARLLKSNLKDPIVYGQLEEKMALTLRLVLDSGEADAKAVHQLARDNTQVTVWNNRLAALEDLGLLARRKVSKTKFYFPILKGMTYGH